MVQVSCQDLGIKDCDYVANAENIEDVVKKMIIHLRQQHDLNMPSASEILWAEDVPTEISRAEKRSVIEEAQTEQQKADKGVQLVVNRLMELLKPFEDSKNSSQS